MTIEDKIKIIEILLKDISKQHDEEGRYRPLEINLCQEGIGEWRNGGRVLEYWVSSSMRC